MKTLSKILGGIIIILLLNFLINLIFVSKNDGKNFLESYIKSSENKKVKVDLTFFHGMNSSVSFFKGTAFFKGLYGNTSDITFKDHLSNRYFK